MELTLKVPPSMKLELPDLVAFNRPSYSRARSESFSRQVSNSVGLRIGAACEGEMWEAIAGIRVPQNIRAANANARAMRWMDRCLLVKRVLRGTGARGVNIVAQGRQHALFQHVRRMMAIRPCPARVVPREIRG